MKLINNLIICLAIAFSLNIALPVFAQDEGSIPEIKQELDQFGQKIPVAKDEPDVFVGKIIKAILAIIGVIFIAMIIYGGLTYATSIGSEEKLGTAKKILTYAIIGIVIIALAYVLTDYILKALF